MIIGPRLFSDLWNDEIYTLKYFTLQPWNITFWDYHVPNNHVFFNVVNHLTLDLFKVSTLKELLIKPWLARVFPFITSVSALWVLYKLGKVIHSKLLGLFAGMVLITTLAYVNFALQVRGYGLSTFLLLVSVYLVVIYVKNGGVSSLVLLVLSVGLLIWTIPSNLIFIAVGLPLILLFLLFKFWKRKEKEVGVFSYLYSRKEVFVVLALGFGVVVGLLIYLPIWNDVFRNEYVDRSDHFLDWQLTYYWEQVWRAMVSGRWLLIVLAGVGYAWGLFREGRKSLKWIWLLLFCVLPLWFPYWSKTITPGRVFIVLSPFFALLFSFGLIKGLELLNLKKTRKVFFVSGLLVYLVFSFYSFENDAIENNITSIEAGRRLQDINEQYYSFAYHPVQMVRLLITLLEEEKLPVYVLGGEPHGITHFLKEFKIPYKRFESERDAAKVLFKQEDSFYLITNKIPSVTAKEELDSYRLNGSVNYHNVFSCQKSIWANRLSDELKRFPENDSVGVVVALSYPWSIVDKNDSLRRFFCIDSEEGARKKLVTHIKNKVQVVYLGDESNSTIGFQALLEFKYLEVEKFGEKNAGAFMFSNKRNEIKLISGETKLESNDEFFSVSQEIFGSSKKAKQWLSLKVKGSEEINPIITFSINRNGEQYYWKGYPISDFLHVNTWSEVVLKIEIPEETELGDELFINIWNKEGQEFRISNIHLE